MRRISIEAVLIGAIVDIVSTNILSIPLMVYVVATRHLTALPKEQISKAFLEAMQGDPSLMAMQFLVGGGCSILGGYLAARIAKRDEILNASLSSFLCVGMGLYALLFTTISAPIWKVLLEFVVGPTMAAIGGYIRAATKRDAVVSQPASA